MERKKPVPKLNDFETSVKNNTRGTTQIAENRHSLESNNSYAFTQQSRRGSTAKRFLPLGSEATNNDVHHYGLHRPPLLCMITSSHPLRQRLLIYRYFITLSTICQGVFGFFSTLVEKFTFFCYNIDMFSTFEENFDDSQSHFV